MPAAHSRRPSQEPIRGLPVNIVTGAPHWRESNSTFWLQGPNARLKPVCISNELDLLRKRTGFNLESKCEERDGRSAHRSLCRHTPCWCCCPPAKRCSRCYSSAGRARSEERPPRFERKARSASSLLRMPVRLCKDPYPLDR
jgi:hypothetical protein